MILYFDGGCKPNPGKMEVAVVSSCGTIKRHQRLEGIGTNNEAEWLAFLLAVEIAKEYADQSLTIAGDSKLVISQAGGQWQVKKEELKPFLEAFKADRPVFRDLKLKHVRRNDNPAGHYIEEMN